MPTDQLTRSFPFADLEIRGDGRTIAGVAVPFSQPARIGSYTESFRRGAFTRTISERGPERIKLLAQHNDQALPLGLLTSAREDPAGLMIEARVSKTLAGDEALELVKDGALDAFSIGFTTVPNGDQWDQQRTSVVRTEVRLHEVSVVAFPAYAGATITSVRSNTEYDPHLDPELLLRWLDLGNLPDRNHS